MAGFPTAQSPLPTARCAPPTARSRQPARRRGRCGGVAMIETLLVLPMVLFVLALVIYFGFAMQRMQRATMMDRYESWRSAARAPGPAVDVTDTGDTRQMRATFFRGDVPTLLTAEATEFFPREPSQAWERGAGLRAVGAQRLAARYFTDLPRGRSMRFYTRHRSDVRLWERLFPGSIVHRHTVMDTQWRFVNHVIDGTRWYDDRIGAYRPTRDSVMPTLDPGYSVREAFYSDFDRRLAVFASSNALAEAIQNFYLLYPRYRGPHIDLQWEPGIGWY